MGRLSRLNASVRGAGYARPPQQQQPQPKQPKQPAVRPERVVVQQKADYTPLIQAIKALGAQLSQESPPADLQAPVAMLLEGLAQIIKAPEIDLTPIVEAIGAIQPVNIPKPPAPLKNMTMDVRRDSKGYISEVVLTAGKGRDSVDVD